MSHTSDGDDAKRRLQLVPPRDYEVGYGKPPSRTRFRSGQSGNPRGRPKGTKKANPGPE